ncbi:hypothetical protein SDC9_156883 [bioreactor metagenome]|uniref:Uncharacterized protein n=1 Tax=bioreactor metagenome TaxID=1076179 RepID=A0A645F7U5_9ZZZZ
MLHCTRTQEQSAFEQAMSQAVEQPGCDAEIGANAQACNDVAQLADGRKCQHTFHIRLGKGEKGAGEDGDAANCDDRHIPGMRPMSHRIHACDQVHACFYVTGGVQ